MKPYPFQYDVNCAERNLKLTLLNLQSLVVECQKYLHPTKRKIRRLATILDPRFKKDKFLQLSNAEQTTKAFQLKLSTSLSKTIQHSQSPKTQPNPYGFVSKKLSENKNRIEFNRYLLHKHNTKSMVPKKKLAGKAQKEMEKSKQEVPEKRGP